MSGPNGPSPLGPVQRRLLALLAIRAGSVVTADQIGELLGLGSGAVRTAVSRLRRVVGDVVTAAPPGYLLDAECLDVHRFEGLLRSAPSAEPHHRISLLEEALGLWRGPALVEFADEDWARGETARLEELRRLAEEDRIDALLAAGRPAEAAAEAQALIEQQLLRERARGLHMRALADQGRTTEALRAYQDYRRHLADEAGLEPSAELARLERRILDGEVSGRSTPTEAGTVVPLPARLAGKSAVGVVGREVETATIADAVKRVAGGEGREVVLISGEAGLGKTTLVASAARAASADGSLVLFGHCEEDLATPYQLFAEALDHFVAHAPEDELVAHVAAHQSELARIVPGLAARLPRLPQSKATDADSERYLLFAAVVGMLAMVSKDQLVVLALDDLQWADTSSLQLLRHVVASDQPMRLLVLGAYRENELSRSSALFDTLAALHRHHGVARIELTGLDDSGVASLMEAAAGHTLDDAARRLASALHRETDGNPFFVTEVLRHLLETGTIAQDPTGRWVPTEASERMALPGSVHRVIGARVGRLGRVAEQVLSRAAVIGRDFDLELLAPATETSEDDLLDVLDAAASSALVRELPDSPGRYSFAHALIQHTLYDDLGPTRRARAHRQVAQALEDLCRDRPGDRVGDLARHWRASQPPDLAKALHYSRQAADAALASLAPADALRHYAQALDLHAQSDSPDPILGIDLAVGLGTAQRQAGDPAFRDTLLDAARRAADLGDTERLAAAALANSRGMFTNAGTIDAAKVEVLEMALDRLSTDNPDRALVLATLCAELADGSPFERRRALADEALAIAKASGDDAIIVRVINDVSFPLAVPALLERSLAWSADALARAERVGDPVLLFWAAHTRLSTAARAGDIDEMDRCLEIIGSLAEQLDQPMLKWWHSILRALRAQIAGNTDQVEQLATEALQLGTDSGQPDATVFFGIQLGVVNFQRGTIGELVPLIEQTASAMPDIDRGHMAGVLAFAYAEGDRTDEARRLLEEFASADFDLPLEPGWLNGMILFAEAAIACRDPKYAGPLFDRLAPWADQTYASGLTIDVPVSDVLGGLATVLGRYDEASTYFTHAAAFSDRVGAKFFAARTNLSWGKMLAERRAPGDTERAKDLLTKAHTAATTHGYANVERRAAAALQDLD